MNILRARYKKISFNRTCTLSVKGKKKGKHGNWLQLDNRINVQV